MSELERKVRYYAQCYYEGHPEISDKEFDNLVEELHCTEPDNIILYTTGYGYYPKVGQKVKHPYGGMQSISRKPRSISSIPDNLDVVRLTPKYDGLSCAVYIKDGKLDFAATRGNGDIGIDVTNKIARILKNKINAEGFTGAVRGELLISRANWKEFIKIHPESEGKSPRNTAAGIMNRDYIDDDINFVEFHPYKYLAISSLIVFEESSIEACPVMDEINRMFSLSEDYTQCFRKDLTQDYLERLYNAYNSNYPCDGIVITNNNVTVRRGLVEYDEVAYKFDTDTEATTVIGIDWNRTRTGKLIPTIVVEPIDLDGATIRRCAGFNAKFIKDNKIGIGAEVTIMRSGGVIPDLQEVVTPSAPDIPERCPCCNDELKWVGVNLECSNSECSGSDEADLFAWIYAIAPVHGLGYSTIKSFLDKTQIETVEDIYSRNLTMNGTSVTAIKLAEMWKKLREDLVDIATALVALNIPRLGWKSATKISEDKELVKDILHQIEFEKRFSIQVQNKICDLVGSATLNSMKNNFIKLDRLRFVADRINHKDNIPVDKNNMESKGEVVITGKLNTCKRSDFEKIITDAGYTLAPAVKKGVLYLITNTPDSGSSKNRKADELGIKKITENEFLEMIK